MERFICPATVGKLHDGVQAIRHGAVFGWKRIME
jgi:hypothetical protein